jgi:hypothetical protein
MSTTRTRVAAAVAAAAGIAALAAAPASAAPADGRCQAAGIATLKTIAPLSYFVQNGVPLSAVEAYANVDTSGLPENLPFQVVLEDHRAGGVLFDYPWCS